VLAWALTSCAALTAAAMPVIFAGCQPTTDREVVVYTALDRQFSEPIFEAFTRETGIAVRAKYDTEANKTVGLVNLILNEKSRPRCDVFWNNEILNTLRLEREQLLASYDSRNGQAFPAEFRSAGGLWYGFAARARVLLVNTQRWSAAARPSSIRDLVDPQWQGEVGIAKPLFGTTATHAACLFAVWGPDEAQRFFAALKTNARVFPGNRQVAEAVGRGQILFGLTDTDDAILELESGRPVAIVYPDQGPGQMGTLFIPNSLALIRGSRHPQPARQLIDYLLAAPVEAQLASGPSAQIPLNPAVESPTRVETPHTVRAMAVDFPQAAAQWQTAADYLRRTGY
jgi:iron(III) transport system substrate-binding protein